MIKKFLLILFASLFITLTSVSNNAAYSEGNPLSDSSQVMNFSFLRDTLFTLKPYYLELNLSTQTGYLHSRNSATKIFGISSGTDRLEKGVKTNEGLFVIQAKLPRWFSRQFDSTLMLDWMGFNFGIGFHALATSGYYNYLGKKKSSHGCVRITRAEAKELYKIIDIGTPVLVHNGESAVTVAFGDSSNNFTYYNYPELHKIVLARLKQMYAGRYFLGQHQYLLIDKSNVAHSGLPIGNSKKILKRQIINSINVFIKSVIPSFKGLMMIKK